MKMEKNVNSFVASSTNNITGCSHEKKQLIDKTQFAQNIALSASIPQVREKSNGLSQFKASSMPNFAASHAYMDRLNNLRRQHVHITIPTTPELMKRSKNTVSIMCTTIHVARMESMRRYIEKETYTLFQGTLNDVQSST